MWQLVQPGLFFLLNRKPKCCWTSFSHCQNFIFSTANNLSRRKENNNISNAKNKCGQSFSFKHLAMTRFHWRWESRKRQKERNWKRNIFSKYLFCVYFGSDANIFLFFLIFMSHCIFPVFSIKKFIFPLRCLKT